ncbi:MAG: tyrosine-type recombinase/integrase [Lachnospiraceae bacterium]|nr:tyrosine-type recombinase/integrase [Lachnospiraceae bacterium]
MKVSELSNSLIGTRAVGAQRGANMRKGNNIYHRKDGRWEARYLFAYDENGKPKFRYFYATTYCEAKNKLQNHIHNFPTESNQDQGTNASVCFRDLANNWLVNVRLKVKTSTYVRYQTQTEKHILPYFGKVSLKKISTEMIEAFVTALLNELSPKTTEDILATLKSILRFGKTDANLDLKRIRIKKDKTPVRVLNQSEQSVLLTFLMRNPTVYNIGILICLYTGIRIGELSALRWEDINLYEQTLHISKTVQRIQELNPTANERTKVIITSPKSKGSDRLIPIPEFLAAIINRVKLDTGYFLTGTESPMEPRTIQNRFKTCLKDANMNTMNFHILRHTYATRYVEAGLDIKSLSESLGHSTTKITLDLYVYSSMEQKQKNAERLAVSTLSAVNPAVINAL